MAVSMHLAIPPPFKLNTGAQANLLPRRVYDQLSNKPPLKPTTTRLMPYDADKPLSVEGQCICTVSASLKEHSITRHLRFFVTSAPLADPSLGLTACEELSLIKRVCANTAVHSANAETPGDLPVGDPVVKDYLPLFQGIGHLSDHQYSIQIKEGAVPYAVSAPRQVC
jgi:hypothetical protein